MEIQTEEPTLKLVIPFESEYEAGVAYNTLVVDKEPKRNQCKKELRCEKNNLILILTAPEPRQLRMSSNSFFDHLALVRKTIDEFSLKAAKVPKLGS
jgi:EKC/KEOPS complex subunit PCC1/LAGE3